MTWDNPFKAKEKTREQRATAALNAGNYLLSKSPYNKRDAGLSNAGGVAAGGVTAGITAGATLGKAIKSRREKKLADVAANAKEGRGSSNRDRENIYLGGRD